jgi:glycosyltransferase involved in cell wall biosynthesis
MRVLHVTSVVDGRSNSGTARVASELIHRLNEHEGIHQTFLHFDASDNDIYELPQTTEILIEPTGKLWGARYLSFLKFAFKQQFLWRTGRTQKYDVVHWHVSRIYPLFHLIPSSKHILTLHDAGGYLLPNVNTFSTRIFRVVAEWSLGKLHSIIVDSNSSKRDLIDTGKYCDEKIKVLYLATNINSAHQAIPDGFTDFVGDEKFLLCVARWQPHKNVESVVKAFAHYIAEQDDGLRLVLVGKPVGSYTQPQNEITKYAIENRTWVTADLSDGELKYLYSHATLNLFPSLHEGFGLSVLEGMTCGCPVIVHAGGATEEIAGSGGIAIDSRNPIEFAMTIKDCLAKRSELSENATNRSKDFSWDKSVDELLRIYNE